MENIHVITTPNPIDEAATATARQLKSSLKADKTVLWLLSGGSSLRIAIEAAKQLADIDLSNLYVTLTDERYGPIDHPNENWHQLLEAGFHLNGAHVYRPLVGDSLVGTTEQFNAWLEQAFEKANYKLGIFGTGNDGHTAGIKPHSPAVTSQQFACSFEAADFTRLTITVRAIARLDEAIIQASGDDKQAILEELLATDRSLNDQPAQVLKTIGHSTLYTTNSLEEIL